MVNTDEVMAKITIKFRHGRITKEGITLCKGVLHQIDWRHALLHPILLTKFLWVYMGLLGVRIKAVI